MSKYDQSGCGCTWERQPGFGDVVVVQCATHAAEGCSPRAKAAMRAADAAVERLRKQGKVPRK